MSFEIARVGTVIPEIEGLPHFSYGHSYGLIQSPANISVNGTYQKRLSVRHLCSSYTNRNIGATVWADTANKVTGSWPTTGQVGLILADNTINNVEKDANLVNGISAMQMGLRTCLWILRAGGASIADAAFTYPSGTWTTPTDANYMSGGGCHGSATPGASFSGTFTGTRAAWITFTSNPGAATVFGTVDLSIDGVFYQTVDNAAQQRTTSQTTTGFGARAVPLGTLSAGSHTLTGVKDGTANQIHVDSLIVESATPPTIVLVKAIYLTTSGYNNNNSGGAPNPTDATVDTFNAAMDTVVAEFPSDGRIVVVDPIKQGWDRTTMLADGIHPNDRGMVFIADCIERKLRNMGFRLGLNVGV